MSYARPLRFLAAPGQRSGHAQVRYSGPLAATPSFTAYARSPFGPDEQVRLARALRALGRRRVAALLSNSDCPETRRLYARLPLDAVDVRRSINSVGKGRGAVSELLVKSFGYPS